MPGTRTSGKRAGHRGGRGRSTRIVVVLVAAAVVIAGGLWLANRAGAPSVVVRRPSSARLTDLVEAGDASGHNVLLVTLDTVRADRLGCYGHESAETPAMDSLVETGVLFDDAVANAPITLPSHATILTGLSPLSHGVRDNGRYRLSDEHVTLAEVLSSRGYDTAAFVGCFVLDARFGLDQGFDVYDFDVSDEGYRPEMVDFNERSAAHVTDAALRWLDERAGSGDAPFFMWVHYFDPHAPYRSPFQRYSRFASRPYDAEIAYVDAQFARLLEGLDEAGEREETFVVVVADHGEALGEHGEPTHGMLVHESTVRVPMILSSTSLFDGAHVVDDRVVSIEDLRPTIEDLLGVQGEAPVDGVSLLRPDDDPDRAIYIETEMPLSVAGWSPLRGLRTHTHKYVLAPTPEFYDLGLDPSESRNLFGDGGSVLADLEIRLSDVLAKGDPSSVSGRSLSDEEVERLESLGYVQSGGAGTDEVLPDPKDMMPTYNDALRAEQLYAQGSYAEAAELAASVLERSDGYVQALRVLAFSYVRLDRPGEAVTLLGDSVAGSKNTFLIRSLVQVLIISGRYEDALDALDTYAAADPLDGRVPLLRGDIHARRGENDQAMASYREAVSLDEHRVGRTARERMGRLQ